jgi:gliding motility-associated-like protein
MKISFLYITLYLLIIQPIQTFGQTDTEPPVTPVFNLLSVQPETGRTELSWSKSPSSDVAGYVLYYYRNGEGFAFDTLHNPETVNYVNYGSFSSYLSESYVVAAIDSSGNISPLSNVLTTMFVGSIIDTCNKTIQVSWNKYPSFPAPVNAYKILISENGGSFSEAGETSSADNTLIINNFETNSEYCFEIRAVLEGGSFSLSNKTCILTAMQRAPRWINADYATINESGNIALSFTFDPLSEIRLFRLERKKDTENSFSQIAEIESDNGKVSYIDLPAVPDQKYSYRLSAINNCGNPIITSNLAGNIVTKVLRSGDIIRLTWNSYRDWLGGISDYKVFINTGNGFSQRSVIPPSDTVFSINYPDIMYDISGAEICFYISATEITNLYYITGESRSPEACTEITERITVPTAFTPDNDMVNDLFKPVLSFTPLEYYMLITDRENNKVFENNDHRAQWDGTRNGNPLPQGVYLWFLKVKTPSGKIISRSGTVTIIKNR